MGWIIVGEFPIYERMSAEKRNEVIQQEKEKCEKFKNWSDVYTPNYNKKAHDWTIPNLPILERNNLYYLIGFRYFAWRDLFDKMV